MVDGLSLLEELQARRDQASRLSALTFAALRNPDLHLRTAQKILHVVEKERERAEELVREMSQRDVDERARKVAALLFAACTELTKAAAMHVDDAKRRNGVEPAFDANSSGAN